MLHNIRNKTTWCSSPCSSEDESWWNVDNVEEIFPCFQNYVFFDSKIRIPHSEFQEEAFKSKNFANYLSGMISFDIEDEDGDEDEENTDILTMRKVESTRQSNESVELATNESSFCGAIIFENSDDDFDENQEDVFQISQSSADQDNDTDRCETELNAFLAFLNLSTVDREITPDFSKDEMNDNKGSSPQKSPEIANSLMYPTFYAIDRMDTFGTSSNDLLTIMPRTPSPTGSDSGSSCDFYHKNGFMSFSEYEEGKDKKESDATNQSNSCDEKCNETLESVPLEGDDSMTKKDKRKIKFNDKNIKYMETYSPDEYERGDELVDEQKALFEMNFEKKLEEMEKVEVTITKGPSGFGFQTSGNLIPSKNGCWMTLSIRSVTPGSPADVCQQIKPGDIILAINDNEMLFVERTSATSIMQKCGDKVKFVLAREKPVSKSDDSETFDPDIDKILESSSDEC